MITKEQASRLRGLVARSAQTAKTMGQDMGARRNYGKSAAEAGKAREAIYTYIRELEKDDGRTNPPG